MPTWKRKLQIKHLLSASDDSQVAQQTGQKIAAAIRASSWHAADVEDAGDTLDSEVEQLADEFTSIEDLEHLNSVLSALYGLADADRVWIH